MNCEHAHRLLPLWIGRDLSDAAEAQSLQVHLASCPKCRTRERQLQTMLDTLQSVSTAATSPETSLRPSVWPRVAAALSQRPRALDRFNGWIPAAAMTLAASLMVAVSIASVEQELGTPRPLAWRLGSNSPSDERNLFETDAQFAPGVVHEQLDNPLHMRASHSLRQEW